MSVLFKSHIDLGTTDGAANRLIPTAFFSLTEEYNAGWRGTAILVRSSTSPVTQGDMMGTTMLSGIVPGRPAVLRIALNQEEDDLDGVLIRSWPSVIGKIQTLPSSKPLEAICQVELMDPISFLANRTIWGAYRACSVAEMIGGALSMAAGGDGKPTLEPALPNLPPFKLNASYRDALDELDYSIAVGQTLGEWLGDMLGLLGLRLEMFGKHDGAVEVFVTDTKPGGEPVRFTVQGRSQDGSAAGDSSPLYISDISAQPGAQARGVVLDDLTQGGFSHLGGGSVGNLFSGTNIGVDEAVKRVASQISGAYVEMLTLHAVSRQPGLRPGRLVKIDRKLRNIDTWQVGQVEHRLEGSGIYQNSVALLVGDASWHPNLPRPRPARVVPGVVDGGSALSYHEPIPRDRLGRIFVRFPFTPAPLAEEAALLAVSDTNRDGRVTLADYAEDFSHYEDSKAREAELKKFLAGEYDDLFPGKADGDLSDQELEKRKELTKSKVDALRYIGYKQALQSDKADRDRDSYVTERDPYVSDELNTALKDSAQQEKLQAQWKAWQADDFKTKYPDADEAETKLALEYGRVFGTDELTEQQLNSLYVSPESRETAERVRRDAEREPQRWPPRLPLSIIQPMAGGLHGFISAHRQGDSCRVVVHDPLWAEVIGFQYRDNQALHPGIKDATAGIVVEHDTRDAWSGIVFRRTGQVEVDPPVDSS